MQRFVHVLVLSCILTIGESSESMSHVRSHAPAQHTLATAGLFRRPPPAPWGKMPLRTMGAQGGQSLAHGRSMLVRGARHVLKASGRRSVRAAVSAAGSRTITLARTFPEAWTRLMQTRPVQVCATLEGLRHLIGDVIAQRIEAQGNRKGAATASKNDGLQVDRLIIMTLWGMWYGGGLGYWSYHHLYPTLFGITGTRAALKTTAMDLLVTCPFVYYPMWHLFSEICERFFAHKGSLFSHGAITAGAIREYGRDVSLTAWTSYKTNFVSDSLSMAAVWTPLHILNFRFIPLTHRFPFIASAGIIWTTVFSYLQFSVE
jgi:hypothetical protein